MDDKSLDGLPEETISYIRGLRQEAARYRTERNDIESKYREAGDLLKEANSKLDTFSALEDQLENKVKEHHSVLTDYEKLKAAAKFGIPDEVGRLQGESYEEWENDAKQLASKLTGKPRLGKDTANEEKPPPKKLDPIEAAFRESGWL